MNEQEFLDWCKDEVVKYTNDHLDKSDNKQITTDDVFMVWCCIRLGILIRLGVGKHYRIIKHC